MRIVHFSPASCYPPGAGAANRTFNLNFELSRQHDVFQFSLIPTAYTLYRKLDLPRQLLLQRLRSPFPLRSAERKINSRYTEYVYMNPLVFFCSFLVSRFNESLGREHFFTPCLLDRASFGVARDRISRCDLVQVDTPWVFDRVYKIVRGARPMVLVEHDIYYDAYLTGALQPRTRFGDRIKEIERKAVDRADCIIVVSESDLQTLHKYYGVAAKKAHVVPNGVDVASFSVSSREDKERAKSYLGFPNKKTVLFTGSKYLPNVQAAQYIHKMAEEINNKDILFVIAGSVGNWVRKEKLEKGNVFYTGFVDDIHPYFRAADIAINPVLSGSGTNIKLLEYMAAGLPVISSEFGIRGLSVKPDEHVLVASMEEFPCKIEKLLSDEARCTQLGLKGRRLVEEHYDWKEIAKRLLDVYQEIARRP